MFFKPFQPMAKYQIIPVHIYGISLDPSLAKKGRIDTTVLKGYKRVSRIWMLSDAVYENSRSQIFSKPLRIGGKDVVQRSDHSFMLFPKKDNKDFYSINSPGDGLAITGELYDKDAPGGGYDMKLILKLE